MQTFKQKHHDTTKNTPTFGLQNFFKTRSSHGNLPVTNPSRPLKPPSNRRNKNNKGDVEWKVIWAISVLICTSICVYQIQERIRYFFDRPVSAKVLLTRNTSILFPAFTICPPFMYRYANLYKFFMKYELDPKIYDITGLITQNFMNVTDFYEWASFQPINLKRKRGKISELLLYLTLNSDMSGGGTVFPNLHNVSTHIGKCLTATFEQPILYQGQGTMFRIMSPQAANITKMVLGRNRLELNKLYTVYVHPNTSSPVHAATVSGFKVLRSHITSISLGVKEYKFLNRSTFLCVSQHDNDMCVGDCVAVNILPHVKCRLPVDFPQLNHLPLCDDPNSFMRFFVAARNAYNNISSMSSCRSKCPRACLETVYVQNVQYLAKTESASAPDMTEVEFYFSDNLFERVEEVFSYSAINLLCDMGGSLGLFLGFSLLTMLDILRRVTNMMKSGRGK